MTISPGVIEFICHFLAALSYAWAWGIILAYDDERWRDGLKWLLVAVILTTIGAHL